MLQSKTAQANMKRNTVSRMALSYILICFTSLSFASDINPERPDELIRKAESENTKCRGGPGDDPYTPVACYERERTMSKINKLGWCWGPRDAYGYQKKWIICSSDKSHSATGPIKTSRLDPSWHPFGSTAFFMNPAASSTPALTASIREGRIHINLMDPNSALCKLGESSGPNEAGPYKVNDTYLKFQSFCLNGTQVFGPSSAQGKDFMLKAVEAGDMKVELGSAPPLIFYGTDFDSVRRELLKTESAL